MKPFRLLNPTSLAVIAAACLTPLALGFPVITDVVELGGDNEPTDTIVAQWTGVTWTVTIAGEPVAGMSVGDSYLVPVFGEEAPCFVDRNHQWNGATLDLPIPDYLLGGEYIMSGNDNRDNANYELTVTVSDAAIVYLLIDDRLPDGDNTTPPNYAEGADPIGWTAAMAWVGTEGFQPVRNGLNRFGNPDFPDHVGVDEGGNGIGPGGDIQQWASVYSKTLPGPGTFKLYQADNASRNMYGVVVKRLPSSVNNPPEISNLAPANNSLFHAPASGLNFTAATISPNNLPADSIKLFLNGTDVSLGLAVAGTVTHRTASYSGLQPNTLYAARIVVADQAGRATTNTFTFDTFNASAAIAIETEDYNYDSGQFLVSPVPAGYADLLGARGTDFHNNNGTAAGSVYRAGDFVAKSIASDVARSAFTDAGATDHQLTSILAGDWWNYTRNVPNASYRVYLRGSSPVAQAVRLDRVTGNATGPNQVLSALGTFTVVPGQGGFTYAPLADAAGNPVVVPFSGSTSLRLTALGASVNLQLNYLLLVPTTDSASTAYLAAATPAAGAVNVPPDGSVQLTLANGSAAVNAASIALSFNGTDVTSSAVKTAFADGVFVTYELPGLLELGAIQTVKLVFSESGGASTTHEWTFTTVPNLVTIPATYATPVGSGQGSGFNFKIRKAPNINFSWTEFTLANTTARANQQLADQLIDPETLEPYVNEAPGPSNNGVGTTPVVNFNQNGTAAGFVGGDEPFPYVDMDYTPDPNNIAVEFTAYVELAAGLHRFGVRSDDGFQLTSGPTFAAAEATLVLGQYEGGRGDGLPGGETTFEFQVEAGGVYPLRLIYYEGNGDARVEFYSIDRTTHTRTLLNSTGAGAVKAFTSRTTQIHVPTLSITSPANGASFPTGPATIVITADAALTGGQIAKVEFFGDGIKIGENTSAPFTLTWSGVAAGPHTLFARATGSNGLAKESAKIALKVAPVVQVNFQNTSELEAPEGYLPDYGYEFGDQGNGFTYGWDLDNTANARNRNNAASPDERYDTFNHLQKPQPAGSLWEIVVPNGRYAVLAVVGESDNIDSTYDLTVENVSILKGTPTDAVRWFEGVGTVTVSDGRLSIGNGPTAVNNKLAFVEIYSLPAEVSRPVIAVPVVAGGNLTISWTHGGKLQETSALAGSWTDVPGNPAGTYTAPLTAQQKFYRVFVP